MSNIDASDIKGLCRLCLSKGENKSVFDRDQEQNDIGSPQFVVKIKDCVSVQINKGDNLPTVICKDCETFIDTCHVFKEKCGITQITLNNLLSPKNCLDTLDEVNQPKENGINNDSKSISDFTSSSFVSSDDCELDGSQSGSNSCLSKTDTVIIKEGAVYERKANELNENHDLVNETTSISVTSSSEKETAQQAQQLDNTNNLQPSSCNAIKISSTVSLPQGYFEDIGKENGEPDSADKKVDDEKCADNGGAKQPDGGLSPVDNHGNNNEAAIIAAGVEDGMLVDRRSVQSVPDSTITSSNEKQICLPTEKMVNNIKREPLDESESHENVDLNIRVKAEPEEYVEEQEDEGDEEGTNKKHGESTAASLIQSNLQNFVDEHADLLNNKCLLCNYVFSSNNSLMRHLQSQKHLRNAMPPEELMKLDLNRTTESVKSEDILPDNSVRSVRQKRSNNDLNSSYNEDSAEEFLEEDFFCKICKRSYCSASELRRHSRSMKHMRNLSIRNAFRRKSSEYGREQIVGGLPGGASVSIFTGPPRMVPSHQKEYICPMDSCSFSTREGSTLLEHMMVHGIQNNAEKSISNPMNSPILRESFAQSLQKIYCKCRQVFTNNSEYLFHLKLCKFVAKVPHHQEVPQQLHQLKKQCRLCDLTFTSNEVYLSHLQIYHKGSAIEQNEPKEADPQSSPVGRQWTQHVTKSGQILYTCIICNKKFKEHYSLNSHLRLHKQQQPAMRRDVCKICSKVFSNYKIFEKHVRGHFLPPNSRKIFCMKCYKTFDHRGEVIAHRATCNSMKMKIYSCTICKHTFKDSYALKDHKIRAHTSILPVQALCTVDIKEEEPGPLDASVMASESKVCLLCNKSFYNFQNMKRHCLTVHRNEDLSFLEYASPDGSSVNTYDEPTTSAISLPPQTTLTESQIDQDKWDCEFCKKQFRSEKLLIYHIEHHCPYLQNITHNVPLKKKPVERYNLKCIICARFLPSSHNLSDPVCVRCMAEFNGRPLEDQNRRNKASTGSDQQSKNQNTSSLSKPSTPQTQSFQDKPRSSTGNVTEEAQTARSASTAVSQSTTPVKGKFFQCPIGKKLFTTEAWMMKHYANCDGSCPSYYNCARCNLNFKSPSMFENHIPKCEAGTIKKFDCSICGKTYSKRDYVTKHKQYAHRRPDRRLSGQQGYDDVSYDYGQWSDSTIMDKSRNSMPQQQRQYEELEVEEEDEEDAQYQTGDDEQGEDHEDEPDVDVVGMDSSLEVIQNEDGTMKTFPCDMCARVFSSAKGLASHLVTHNRTNSRSDFECKFCLRGDLLQSQIYSHTYRCIKYLLAQEPTISCKYCHGNFNRSQQTKEFSASLIQHIFDCYEIPYYKNEDDGGRNPRLLCYLCCHAFSSQDRLRHHKAEHARKSASRSYSKKIKRKIRSEFMETLTVAGDDSSIDGQHFSAFESPPRKLFRDAKLFKCKVCDRKFFSINKLKNHEKVHGIIKQAVYSEETPGVAS